MLTIYSKSNCQYCVMAKQMLDTKHIPYNEIKVDVIPAARQFIIEAGHKTVPQIYKGDSLFVEGGYLGLIKLSDNEIKERLSH